MASSSGGGFDKENRRTARKGKKKDLFSKRRIRPVNRASLLTKGLQDAEAADYVPETHVEEPQESRRSPDFEVPDPPFHVGAPPKTHGFPQSFADRFTPGWSDSSNSASDSSDSSESSGECSPSELSDGASDDHGRSDDSRPASRSPRMSMLPQDFIAQGPSIEPTAIGGSERPWLLRRTKSDPELWTRSHSLII